MNAEKNDSREIRRFVLRAVLFLYDAIAVNISFFMAIIIRFYIEYRFYDRGAEYMQMFWRFAPWYTGACLVVFLLFRLYRGVWRYVGINDIQKLILANILTWIIQVAGTLIFIGRMPLTYYGIGAFGQLFLMCLPRVIPRLVIETLGSTGGNAARDMVMPLMIVGLSENTRFIQRKVSKDKTNIAKPVCILDYSNEHSSSTFNGLPVVSGEEGMQTAIDKYGVKCAIMADDDIPETALEHIQQICEKNEIELRRFTLRAETHTTGLRLVNLLEMTDGPVKIVENDPETQGKQEKTYDNAQEALEQYRYNYTVEKVSAESDEMKITVHPIRLASISPDEEWVKRYREENGGEVSFFV